MDPSIDRTPGRTGKWTADEDDLLKNAVQGTAAIIGLKLPRWCLVER
jgi:hypothetical protein